MRKAFLTELVKSLSAISQDAILTNTVFEDVSSKKHKTGESLFSSFNFDDLKDFEPLEVVLRELRKDPNSKEGVEKLMTMDTLEMVEHSQGQ